MIGMPGDDVANRLLQLAADFVGLVSDKGGAAKRLTELAAATAAAEAKIVEARQAQLSAISHWRVPRSSYRARA